MVERKTFKNLGVDARASDREIREAARKLHQNRAFGNAAGAKTTQGKSAPALPTFSTHHPMIPKTRTAPASTAAALPATPAPAQQQQAPIRAVSNQSAENKAITPPLTFEKDGKQPGRKGMFTALERADDWVALRGKMVSAPIGAVAAISAGMSGAYEHWVKPDIFSHASNLVPVAEAFSVFWTAAAATTLVMRLVTSPNRAGRAFGAVAVGATALWGLHSLPDLGVPANRFVAWENKLERQASRRIAGPDDAAVANNERTPKQPVISPSAQVVLKEGQDVARIATRPPTYRQGAYSQNRGYQPDN